MCSGQRSSIRTKGSSALFFRFHFAWLCLIWVGVNFDFRWPWVELSIFIRRFRFPPVSYCLFSFFSNIPKYFHTTYWIVFFSHNFVSHFPLHWTHKYNNNNKNTMAANNQTFSMHHVRLYVHAFVCLHRRIAIGGKYYEYYQRHTLLCSAFASTHMYIYICIFKNTFNLFQGARRRCRTTSRYSVLLWKAMNCHFTHAIAVLMYWYLCICAFTDTPNP